MLNNNLFQEDPVFQTLPDFQPKWAQLHLRFAPKFQGQKTNAGEEGVETPNLGSWAAGHGDMVHKFYSYVSEARLGKAAG